jgi:hypothetical protein
VITYVQLMDTGVHGPQSIEFCLELAYVLVKRCTSVHVRVVVVVVLDGVMKTKIAKIEKRDY